MKKQNRLAFFWILLLLISFQRLYAQRPNILFILADDMSYALRKDPYNVNNVTEYVSAKKELSEKLLQWMQNEKDPRVNGGGDEIDRHKPTTWAWITKWSIEFVKE